MKIYLVSCVSKKRPQPCRAKDLYLSDWFLKARRYVEYKGCPWFILSALHGLVEPNTVIAPYEKTLNTMPRAEREQWGEVVLGQIQNNAPAGVTRIVFLAGDRYREFLVEPLKQMEYEVGIPMFGLKIGEQLSWLKAKTPTNTLPPGKNLLGVFRK